MGRTRPDQTGFDKPSATTAQRTIMLDETWPDGTGPDLTRLDETRQDTTGLDKYQFTFKTDGGKA